MEKKVEQKIDNIAISANDKINAETFFINVYNQFKKSALMITFQSISPILKELSQTAERILKIFEKKYDFDSTYMLPFMLYLNQINQYVKIIEGKAIKNGIKKSLFNDDCTFSHKISSIKESFDLFIAEDKPFIDDNLFIVVIKYLQEIEKKIVVFQEKLIEYVKSIDANPNSDKWPIIEIINALYLNEPENQYADNELLLYDCSLKLYPFNNTINSEEIKDWNEMKNLLVEILKKNFYTILSFSSKENIQLKCDNLWEIKVITKNLK